MPEIARDIHLLGTRTGLKKDNECNSFGTFHCFENFQYFFNNLSTIQSKDLPDRIKYGNHLGHGPNAISHLQNTSFDDRDVAKNDNSSFFVP